MCKDCFSVSLKRSFVDQFPGITLKPFHPLVLDCAWIVRDKIWMDGITSDAEYEDLLVKEKALIASLASEWPHIPETKDRIGYWRAPDHAATNRVTVAKLGSYLTRHFPLIPGHEIEKMVQTYRGTDRKVVIIDAPNIVSVMLAITAANTAVSCMTKGGWPEERHPYRVFEDPKNGWAMVCMYDGGIPTARCLVNNKKFIRIYGSCTKGEYSKPDDPMLRSWLEKNGYEQIAGWDGFNIKAIKVNNAYLGPYLDGSCDNGKLNGSIINLCNGPISFGNVNGYASYEDHDGQMMGTNGDWIDENEAVELANGDIVHRGSAYYVESEDGYYSESEVISINGEWELLENYTEVIYLNSYNSRRTRWILTNEAQELANGDYVHTDDAVVDELNDEWIAIWDAVQANDGTTMHKDYLDQYEADRAKTQENEEVNV